MTVPILRVNLGERMCVIMKCNTVLPGIANYTTGNTYLDVTNKTYFENDKLLWKYAIAKNLFWDEKEQL